ncbi:hypothetical protein NQ317_003340 [Molorchus minor]|uniref:Peptidase S1 domain-containing protein n=1 Tax=Molorchus minor TaxID=1323400 RepID=A0ABQ9JFR6_9CUCU|nr:hypothetical protein NQ317_003340 [Molorchus minor]
MDIITATLSFLWLFNLLKQGSSIIGGYEVEPHSIPYQAFLNITGIDNSIWVCGGSLITSNFILTAGRCCYSSVVKVQELVLFRSYWGAHDISKEEGTQQRLETTNFTTHPGFNEDTIFLYENDIAIIALPESVRLDATTQTIKLYDPEENNTLIGETGKIGGWGLTSQLNETSYSTVLMAEDHGIVDKMDCLFYYPGLEKYDFCVETGIGSTPGIGDFGSPLAVNDVQVGIASQNVALLHGIPFVFTGVSDFLGWIKEMTDYDDQYVTTTSTTTISSTSISTTVADTTSTELDSTTEDTTSTTTLSSTSISTTVSDTTSTESDSTTEDTTGKAQWGTPFNGVTLVLCSLILLSNQMDIRCNILVFILSIAIAKNESILLEQTYGFPNQRIVGGYEVEPHSIPYQAFLSVTDVNGKISRCGGSLITPNYILTAGQCCRSAETIQIVLGAHNIAASEDSQIKLETTECNIHPQFNMDVAKFVYEMDIAVIPLPKAIELNDNIQTVRLPNPYDADTFADDMGRISGWGLTDNFDDASYSAVLLAQENIIISNEKCASNAYDELKTYDICMATNNSESPCVGDFGSPLTVNSIQVGIASQGVDYCVPGYPFINTRVSEFLSWIKEVTDYEDDFITPATDVTNPSNNPSTNNPSTSTVTSVTTTSPGVTTDETPTTTNSAYNVKDNVGMYYLAPLPLLILMCI